MMIKVLRIISENKSISINAIAEQLNVSKAVIMQVIKNLIDMEYIKKIELKCDGGCKGCSNKSSCADNSMIMSVMEITEKGKEMLE